MRATNNVVSDDYLKQVLFLWGKNMDVNLNCFQVYIMLVHYVTNKLK